MCTADGGRLEQGAQARIAGPAALSVADARVEEAEGATLDFVVTLSRQRTATTTVAYATSDGTARAGDDYESTSGTLTFAPGDTEKTIEVTVLNDAHDESEETMTLTLSNAVGARIEDGTATGTIENTDPMPKAWMVRFGRTVGSQVVDALTERLDGAQSSHVTVGGVRLRGETPDEPEAETDDPFALPAWATEQREAGAQSMTGRQLLLGSAFHLSSAGEGAGAGPALRTLVAHEASGYKEWGASGAIRVNPSASGRGLTLSIAPEWGRTGSATEQLWGAGDARALSPEGAEFEPTRRLAMDAGYGFGLSEGRGVLTPYAGMTLGEQSSRTMRGGAKWQLGPDVAVGLEATRDDAGETSSSALQLRAALRF